MTKLKEIFSDKHYLKVCCYVALTTVTLFIVYLFLTNLREVFYGILHGFQSVSSALSPLIIGLILSYLLAPIVNFVDLRLMARLSPLKIPDPDKQKKKEQLRRTFSILLTYLLILAAVVAIIYAFAFMILGKLVFDGIGSMVDSITAYFLQYEQLFREIARYIPNSGLEEKLQDMLNSAVLWVYQNFSATSVISTITNLGGGILNVFLGVIVSIYVLKDREFFQRLWRKFLHVVLPMSANAKVSETLSDVNIVIGQFLRGQLLDALIIAILSSIGLTVIGLDFAVFIGCFAGICNVIPYFGPFLGMVPAAIIGLVGGGISQAVLAVVVLFVIQQVDSAVISPKIVGTSIGLHPVFVLTAVTVGGYYFGIIGMLLSVPVAAILRLFIVKKLDAIE